jgi:hypothetical protein
MLLLLTSLLIKHWLCDFPWQSQWMVVNKGNWRSPALFVHVYLHVICTAVVLFAHGELPGRMAAPVLMLELLAHVVIDFLKAHKRIGGRWRIDQPRFWTVLGLDQLLHGLTYILMVHLLTAL